jgi:2,5-furandicarboxylate decarboxylase 1
VIGVEPAIYVTANAKLPYGYDELACAGALRREPVEVVKCKSIDLEVPAHAEVVIEGEFRPPFDLGEEGPWPEYLRYLGMPIQPPIMHITAITYRRDPINVVFIPGTGGGEASFGLANQAQFLRVLKDFAGDFVLDAFLTPSSAFHQGVIKVRKTEAHHEGLQINVALAAFHFSPYLDAVTLVDEDINIYDLADVDWAICSRCNPGRQFHILPEGRSHQINPIVGVRELSGGVIGKAKLIIDATIPWEYKVREVSPGITFFTRSRWSDVDLAEYVNGDNLRKLRTPIAREHRPPRSEGSG